MSSDDLNDQINTSEEFELKTLEFSFQAAITEYQAIREATLSRDQYRNSLLNYLILVITGMLIALEFIINAEAYFSFLIVAILIAGIGLLYIFNSKLNTYLLFYEHTILRQQIEDVISTAGERANRKYKYKALQWQEFYRNLTLKQHKVDGVMNVLSFGLTGSIPFLVAIGCILIFFAIRPTTPLSNMEIVLLVIASVFIVSLLVMTLHASISGSTLWAEISKSKLEKPLN